MERIIWTNFLKRKEADKKKYIGILLEPSPKNGLIAKCYSKGEEEEYSQDLKASLEAAALEY